MSLFNDNEKILVSASQITNFRNCNRYWWWNKIKGKEIKKTPALSYGTQFHKCIEESYGLMKTGCTVDEMYETLYNKHYEHEIVDLVDVGWKKNILGLPENFLVEKGFNIPIGDFGIMRGSIDFYNVSEIRIEDHKTISSWQYALEEDDLKYNVQLMIYAYYILSKLPDKEVVSIRHNQFHKIAPETSRFVQTEVTKKEVFEYWESMIVETVQNMIKYSKEMEEKNVPVKRDHCSSYGGCPFLTFCSR
jgi:hypothetical protein